ncbi:MAG: flippase [Balneolales bacterium]|nr:flippase [Balneolales bacterium]
MGTYRMLRMLAAFGVAVMVARYLGPEQYGMLSYALALVMLVTGIAGPGMKDVLTRQLAEFPARQYQTIRAGFRLMLGLNTLTLILAMALIILLRPQSQILWLLTAILGLGNLLRAFEAYELWYHFRLKMSRTVLVQAASFFTFALFKLMLIWWDAGLIWIAAAVTFELLGNAAGFWLLYRKDPPDSADAPRGSSFRTEKLILSKSLPVMGGFLFTTALFKADQLMLGRFSGDAGLGFYAVAVQFSEYWLYLAAALVLASYPNLLAARKSSIIAFEQQFRRLCSILIYSAAAIAVPVWLTGERIILFFLGDAFLPSSQILSIHIWAVIFVFLIEILKKYFVIENLLVAYLKITAFASLLNIGLNFLLIPLYGGTGAAWASVIAYSAAGFWGLWLFRETRRPAQLIFQSVLIPIKWLINRLY